MGRFTDQIFQYKMDQRIAFKDDFSGKILYGVVLNRWIEGSFKMYRVQSHMLLNVPQFRILGFFKENV